MTTCGSCPHFHSIPSAKVENRDSMWGLCMLHHMATHKDNKKLDQCPEPNFNMQEAHSDV
jgi:hypothetical protein